MSILDPTIFPEPPIDISYKYLKVASRSNFIAKYVGYSEKRTEQFLTTCLGKVLLIEEAHCLQFNINDSFGTSVLMTMDAFVAQHPNDIVIVFSGSKDILDPWPHLTECIQSKEGEYTAKRLGSILEEMSDGCDEKSTEDLLQIFKMIMYLGYT